MSKFCFLNYDKILGIIIYSSGGYLVLYDGLVFPSLLSRTSVVQNAWFRILSDRYSQLTLFFFSN